MNIFILDNNVKKCVQFHCDKHIVKMVTETSQLLSYVYREIDVNVPNFLHKIRKSHLKHPCTLWTKESLDNFIWLCKFGKELYYEYQYRYNKPFKHWKAKFIFEWCLNNPPNLPKIGLTPFARAIKKEKYPDLLDEGLYPDIVECYREYYRRDKKEFTKYKKRGIPIWLNKK